MSAIRKQSIQSSIIVYFGFLVGAFNMYFYSRNGSFTTDQFGLTRLFIDFAQNIFAFASLGTIPVLYKFFPYYKDNLSDKKNTQPSIHTKKQKITCSYSSYPK
jgi:hypothetical protein